MNPLDLLDAIEATSSRKEKEALLAQADMKMKGLLLASMNPYWTYGLQNIPAPPPNPCDEVGQHIARGLEVDEVLVQSHIAQLGMILDELRDRTLVGNEAREVVGQFLKELPSRTAKWFHRVIIKDLNCGMTSKTVNKVFPGLVPAFDVQLAEDVSKIKSKSFQLKFPVWVDYKLDGIRCICIKEGTNVTLYTRRGHVIDTLPTLAGIISRAPGDFVLDGEVMGGSWNESQSTVFATKNTVDDSGMFYNVFDALTVEEWMAQSSRYMYTVRREFARNKLADISHTQVRLVGGMLVGSQKLVDDFYEGALREGHEGIMIKDPEATYQFKRSRAVLKRKPHSTWEGTVVGWAKGEPNSKWSNMFGAFQVRFKDGGPVTSVGGGFTDQQRLDITHNLTLNAHAYDGLIIEVKGQELTKDGVVRFPVFVRFRDARDK